MTTGGKEFLGWTLVVVGVLSAVTLGWRYYDYTNEHDQWEQKNTINQAFTFGDELPNEPEPPSTPAYLIGIAVCAIGAFVCLNTAITDKRNASGSSAPEVPS